MDLRSYGIVALIRSQLQIEIDVQGQNYPRSGYWFTDAYEHRDGRWQIVWSQAPPRRRSCSWKQTQNLRFNTDAVETDESDGGRQPEPAWPRTPRIEPEHAIFVPLGECFMRVPEDNNTRIHRNRITREIAPIVDHVYLRAPELGCRCDRKGLSPGLYVNVASYSRHRSDFGEALQNLRTADVACVHNRIATYQSVCCFRPEQTMSV